MTYTPLQEDPGGMQSFQEQTGFSPVEKDLGGDELRRARQETEQRRDLFDQSRRAQDDLRQKNRRVNDANFQLEQIQPLEQLKEYSKTIGDFFIERDKQFVEKQIAEEELKVADGFYDEILDPSKQDQRQQPGLSPEEREQVTDLEASGRANDEAQQEAAQTGNFDLVKLIRSKRPDVQLGIAKALLRRAQLEYGAKAEDLLLQRFPNQEATGLKREQQLAEIRKELLAPITSLLSPGVIKDSKILETVVQEDSKILTRAVNNDRITYGRNEQERLNSELAQGLIRPEDYVQQVSVLPDSTGRRARGRATAYQQLENVLSTTPLKDNQLFTLEEQQVFKDRPGMLERIKIRQRRLQNEITAQDDNDVYRKQLQNLTNIETAISNGEGTITNEEWEKQKAAIQDAVRANPGVYGRLQGAIRRIDGLTVEAQAEKLNKEQNDEAKERLNRQLLLGTLTREQIVNSGLSAADQLTYIRQLGNQGNVQANSAAAGKVRAEIRDLFKDGILKSNGGGQESGGLVNGIFTDYAMAKYAEFRKGFLEDGNSPEQANILAKAAVRQWILDNGGGIKGAQEVANGIFTKNPETGEWRLIEQLGTAAARSQTVGQATRQYIDEQSGDEWYKQRAVVASMPGGYTQFSTTQGTLLNLSEVRQIVKDVKEGKQITIPTSVAYAARVKGISPLTLINGQIEAFKEIDSTLEPIESVIENEMEDIKRMSPERWAELTRNPSPNRSARALAAGGTGGPIGWDPTHIPPIDGQNVSQVIQQAATSNGENPALLAGLLEQENGFKRYGCSPAGACGAAQFMPATAAQYGLDVYNVNQSIQTAGRYLADIRSYLGTTNDRLVYTAYNWGMGNVGKLIDKLGEQGAIKYLQDLADGKTQVRRGLYVPSEAYEYFHKVTKWSMKYGNQDALRSSATMTPTYSQLAAQ